MNTDEESPSDERPICFRHPHHTGRVWGECSLCQGENNRERTDRLRELILEIKANPPTHPEAERTVLKRLHAADHPNADEFLKVAIGKTPTSKRNDRGL